MSTPPTAPGDFSDGLHTSSHVRPVPTGYAPAARRPQSIDEAVSVHSRSMESYQPVGDASTYSPGAIQSQIDQNLKCLNALAVLVDQLEAKLKPALREPREQGDNAKAIQRELATTPMGNALLLEHDVLQHITDRITDLQRRIDL